MDVFAGPYRAFKTQKDAKSLSAYESVISLCIMTNNSVSERFYTDKRLINTQLTRCKSLSEAVNHMIRRLEQLMQKESYSMIDVLDKQSLQDMVALTSKPIAPAPRAVAYAVGPIRAAAVKPKKSLAAKRQPVKKAAAPVKKKPVARKKCVKRTPPKRAGPVFGL